MAGAAILRKCVFFSSNRPFPLLSLTFCKYFRIKNIEIPKAQSQFPAPTGFRKLCSSSSSQSPSPTQHTRRRTAVKFTVPSSAAKTNFSSIETSESESDDAKTEKTNNHPRELPPPYDPFSKDPVIKEPSDPKNLQEIFHGMKSDGLLNNAVKMFDGLSKDGLTHQALDLFSQMKDKGEMPEVVAHTAVIEAYANAGGQSKAALKAFMRMLSCGVAPNAYTYAVLIKGLAGDGNMVESMKYVREMIGNKMKPNAGTFAAVAEGFVKEMKAEEGRKFFEEVKDLGFAADEIAVRELLKGRRGQVVRGIKDILFGK